MNEWSESFRKYSNAICYIFMYLFKHYDNNFISFLLILRICIYGHLALHDLLLYALIYVGEVKIKNKTFVYKYVPSMLGNFVKLLFTQIARSFAKRVITNNCNITYQIIY